jgi:hypothetical protein
LFKSVEQAGIFHSHSFLIHYLNANKHVNPSNELEFGMKCLSLCFSCLMIELSLKFLCSCRGHQLQPPSDHMESAQHQGVG